MRWHAGKARGWIGEELAAQYLAEKGYTILARNARSGRGELDIVCLEGDELVFVEVKTRRSFPDGEPVQVLSVRQEKMLKYTADGYMQEHIHELTPMRFDLVGVVEGEGEYRIIHVTNALTG